MVNIELDDIPKELIPTVKSLHQKYEIWYPKWVQTVTYTYKSEKKDAESVVAENYTSYPYRRISVCLFSNFIQAKDKYREEVFLHEVLHSITGVFTVPVFDVFEKLIKDEDLGHIIVQEFIDKIEGFTQDLTYSILNSYASNEKKENYIRSKSKAKRQTSSTASEG